MKRRSSSSIGHSPTPWQATRVGALAVVACLGAGAVLAPPAAAANTDVVATAANALTLSPLYVADPGTVVVNQTAVLGGLTPKIKIAVLPAGVGQPGVLATEIGHALDPSGASRLTVGVIVGSQFGASSSAFCAGYAGQQAAAAVTEHKSELTAGSSHPDLTSVIEDFARRAQTGPLVNTNACVVAALANTAGATGGGFGWLIWVALTILLVVVAGGIGLVLAGVRRQRSELAVARAAAVLDCGWLSGEVDALLAHDLNAFGGAEGVRADGVRADGVRAEGVSSEIQSLADATERFNAAGALLARAASIDDYAQARRAALEGLHAARAARVARGMEAAPDLPPVEPARGEQLAEVRNVDVSGETYRGYPAYTPGARYYYGGGSGVPGGWYGSPFWETMPIDSVLSTGFGDESFGDGSFDYERLDDERLDGSGLGDEDLSDGSDSGQRW